MRVDIAALLWRAIQWSGWEGILCSIDRSRCRTIKYLSNHPNTAQNNVFAVIALEELRARLNGYAGPCDPAWRVGALTLSRIGRARQLDVLRVECTKCDRKGRYHVHKLIEKYGRNGNMMKWREMLNADCPKRDASQLHDRCDLVSPDLPKVL